jgi:hypothetical protein
MADNHYTFDRTGSKAAGVRLGIAHEALEQAIAGLTFERDTMTQMLDGDGSADEHFEEHVAAYGFTDTADAHAAYGELTSLLGKLTTDESVTGVRAAIDQFLARFRN